MSAAVTLLKCSLAEMKDFAAAMTPFMSGFAYPPIIWLHTLLKASAL